MNIFSKLFKKNTSNYNLINKNNIISMPPKEFYKENISLYNEYFKKYNNILLSKKTITSIDLNINNINVTNYNNLITNTMFELDEILNLVNNKENRCSEIITLLLSKLNYYSKKLQNYKKILFIELKVLKDILKLKPFLKHNKKEGIKNYIEIITNNLVIIESNITSINLEISSYLKLISVDNLESKPDELIKRYNENVTYLKALNIFYKEEISIDNLVYMEVFLEKSVDNINYDLNTEENIENISKNIIILTYLIKYKHDEKYIKILENLVNKKYKIIKEYYQENNYKYNLKTGSILEEKIYTRLLEEEINNMFSHKFDSQYKNSLLPILKEVLKYNNSYNTNKLLGDNFKLSILFNRYDAEKIQKTLLLYKVELIADLMFSDIYRVIIDRLKTSEISLYTLFTYVYETSLKIENINKWIINKNNILLQTSDYKNLYKLYLYVENKINKNYYEPLKEVNKFVIDDEDENYIVKKINKSRIDKINNTKYFFANENVKNLYISIKNNKMVNGITFNMRCDALETAYINIGKDVIIDEVTVGKNVGGLRLDTPVRKLYFKQAEENVILNNISYLEEFLKEYLKRFKDKIINLDVKTFIYFEIEHKLYSFDLYDLIIDYKTKEGKAYQSISLYIAYEIQKIVKKEIFMSNVRKR